MSSYGTVSTSTAKIPRIRARPRTNNSIRPIQYIEERSMKLTFKQRIRNWLMNDDNEEHYGHAISMDDCEQDIDLQSNSFRLKVYNASGGTIIETTKYDRKNDENRHSLHVVTDDKDLGDAISKIITMETLR